MQLSVGTTETDLTCPVTHVLLTTAVSLHPCQDKVNQSAAKTLFGDMKEGQCSIKGPCPVCKKIVQGYFADDDVRALAKKVAASANDAATTPSTASTLSRDSASRASQNDSLARRVNDIREGRVGSIEEAHKTGEEYLNKLREDSRRLSEIETNIRNMGGLLESIKTNSAH